MKEETTEVLNYDSENHSFIKYSSNLGDMYTKIRQVNCWDIEDIIPELDLKYMKLVDELFERAKLQSKKIKNNEDAELIKIIFNSIPKPKENQFKCNIKFNEDDPKSLRIDYYCLNAGVGTTWNDPSSSLVDTAIQYSRGYDLVSEKSQISSLPNALPFFKNLINTSAIFNPIININKASIIPNP